MAFIICLLFCYLLSLIVICCVMVTKQRKYKNVSHISWISGVTTLLVITIIGCSTVFGGLQIYDACQVYEYSKTNRTVTGLSAFYTPALQILINTCVYPPNALNSEQQLVSEAPRYERSLAAYNCSKISLDYIKMWDSICNPVLMSMVEVTVLTMLIFPAALAAAISGLIFVDRNKVDVP